MMYCLMAISPLDGRYHEKITILREIFSEFGLIKFRVKVEAAWLLMLCQANLTNVTPLANTAKSALLELMENFTLADAEYIKEIEKGINHDVKAVEYFIKERIATHSELIPLQEYIHFGCTSEDINNIAYALMLKTARQEALLPLLNHLTQKLQVLATEYAHLPMLAHTHGQAATPTTLGKEFANFIMRLKYQIAQLTHLPIWAKLNGASGNYNAFTFAYPKVDWLQLSERFVSQFGLSWNAYTTQIEPHDGMAEFFAILLRINTILIDFNRDIWGYISLNYLQQKALANEVGSSTMPHKINPIDFENAEGNLGVANALLEHFIAKLPISRWQRDLSDSTVLRNIGVAFGHSILGYQSTLKGLEKITPNHDKLHQDLENHWEILAEAIQTMMRTQNLPKPYEQLKNFTRGKTINKNTLHDFIQSLDLADDIKKELLKLTPHTYLGYAEKLAKEVDK